MPTRRKKGSEPGAEKVQRRSAIDFVREEIAAGSRMVRLGHQGAVRANPGRRVAIGTHRLETSLAIVVLMQVPGDPMSRVAVVGHYDELARDASARHLQHLLRRYVCDGMHIVVAIVSPGFYADDRNQLRAVYAHAENWWSSHLQSILPGCRVRRHYVHGGNATRIRFPDGVKPINDPRTLLVEYPPGNGEVKLLVEGVDVDIMGRRPKQTAQTATPGRKRKLATV